MIFLFPRWDMLIPWRVSEDFREHTFGLPKAASSMAKFSTDRTIKDGRLLRPGRELLHGRLFGTKDALFVFWVTSDLFSHDASQLFSDRKREPRDFCCMLVCFLGQKSNQHSTTANGQPYRHQNYFSFLNNGVMHFFFRGFLGLKRFGRFFSGLPLSGFPNPPGVCGRHLGGETGSEAFGKVARWIQTVAIPQHKWGGNRFGNLGFCCFFMGGMVNIYDVLMY